MKGENERYKERRRRNENTRQQEFTCTNRFMSVYMRNLTDKRRMTGKGQDACPPLHKPCRFIVATEPPASQCLLSRVKQVDSDVPINICIEIAATGNKENDIIA